MSQLILFYLNPRVTYQYKQQGEHPFIKISSNYDFFLNDCRAFVVSLTMDHSYTIARKIEKIKIQVPL